MKIFLSVILCLLFFHNFSTAQSFEGKIIYRNSYKSKVSSFNDVQLQSIAGSQNLYYIKGGNYKSVLNGNVVASYTYLSKDNKLYTEFQEGNILYWTDAGENKDSILSYELKRNATQILGYKCDELILHTRKGTQVYDFATKFSINPSLFKKHKYQNWNYYLQMAASVPLRRVIEEDQMIITSIATAVIPSHIEDGFFALPADDKLVKSPY